MAEKLQAKDLPIGDIDKLKHMLGVCARYKKSQWGFRNYYAFGGGEGETKESLTRLVDAGLVKQGRVYDKGHYYYATIEGCKFLGFTKAQIARAFED